MKTAAFLSAITISVSLFFTCLTFQAMAQNKLFIPDTLSGTSFNLTLKNDSVPFFPGVYTQTFGYNNYKYLGPTLFLDKGSNVNMLVKNTLNDTTTVHWHGLHVSAVNDGGPHTMILPNATWNPQFTVLNNAAMYWYHPHPHKKTGLQALRGAAGLIIVRDSVETALALPRKYGIDDFPIVVQSHEFDSLNQISVRGMQDSIVLVNGTQNPYLNVPAQVVRFRLLNASNERNFNFGFTGNKSFYVIGNDAGLLNSPVLTTRIRLSPGERVELLINVSGMSGQVMYLMSYASEFPMGIQGGIPMSMPENPPMDSPLNGVDFNILQLNILAPTSDPVLNIPNFLVANTPFIESQANKTRTIAFTAQDAMSTDGPFFFNGKLYDMERVDYTIPLGNTEIWLLKNQTAVSHPFHIHGVSFYVLDRDAKPSSEVEKGSKDVVLVPPGEVVRLIAKFENFADTIIPYMYHCHMLMHEDDGMMGQYVISKGGGTSTNFISDSANNVLMLYPNPAKEILTIKINNLNATDLIHVKVYNTLGKIVFSNTYTNQQFSINTSEWSKGLYTVSVSQNKNNSYKKFIIE